MPHPPTPSKLTINLLCTALLASSVDSRFYRLSPSFFLSSSWHKARPQVQHNYSNQHTKPSRLHCAVQTLSYILIWDLHLENLGLIKKPMEYLDHIPTVLRKSHSTLKGTLPRQPVWSLNRFTSTCDTVRLYHLTCRGIAPIDNVGERAPVGVRLADPPANIPPHWNMCKTARRFQAAVADMTDMPNTEKGWHGKLHTRKLVERKDGMVVDGEW